MLTYVMPIIWCVVSVPIAIALYKTSVALYSKGKVVHTEDDRQKVQKVKQFLLGGSAAIAALAYFGMQKGTMVLKLDESKREPIRAVTKSLRRNAQDLRACFGASPASCTSAVASNEAAISELERALTAFDE